jgi:hypothetical protein
MSGEGVRRDGAQYTQGLFLFGFHSLERTREGPQSAGFAAYERACFPTCG